MRLRPWLVALAVLATVGGMAWHGLGQIHVSVGYSVRVPFETLPPNDDAFEAWLKTLPGVIARTVHVERKEHAVGVNWIMSRRAGRDEPMVPNILAAFEAHGYRGAGPVQYVRPGSGDW